MISESIQHLKNSAISNQSNEENIQNDRYKNQILLQRDKNKFTKLTNWCNKSKQIYLSCLQQLKDSCDFDKKISCKIFNQFQKLFIQKNSNDQKNCPTRKQLRFYHNKMLKKYRTTNLILQKLSEQIQKNQQQEKEQKRKQQQKKQTIKLQQNKQKIKLQQNEQIIKIQQNEQKMKQNKVKIDLKNAKSKQEMILMKLKQLKNSIFQSYIIIRNKINDQRRKRDNQQQRQYRLGKKLELQNQRNKTLMNKGSQEKIEQKQIKKSLMQKSQYYKNTQIGVMRILMNQKLLKSCVLQYVRQCIQNKQYTQKDGKKQFPQMHLSFVRQTPIKIKRKKENNPNKKQTNKSQKMDQS